MLSNIAMNYRAWIGLGQLARSTPGVEICIYLRVWHSAEWRRQGQHCFAYKFNRCFALFHSSVWPWAANPQKGLNNQNRQTHKQTSREFVAHLGIHCLCEVCFCCVVLLFQLSRASHAAYCHLTVSVSRWMLPVFHTVCSGRSSDFGKLSDVGYICICLFLTLLVV